MDNILISRLDQTSNTYPYVYANRIEPFNPLLFIDENLQKILAKALMIEEKKHRINLSLNFFPKKIVTNYSISYQTKETTAINNDTKTNVNISLTDDSSLKFYVEEGISV